jgi:predicted transcriptional regulator
MVYASLTHVQIEENVDLRLEEVVVGMKDVAARMWVVDVDDDNNVVDVAHVKDEA